MQLKKFWRIFMKILIINGPNINMLGIREKNYYGENSYDFLVSSLKNLADKNNIEIDFYQSNHEGCLVDKIQEAYYKRIDGIVINPAAYTHTSIAILDALKSVSIPTVEVHISDINNRDEFRKKSFISEACAKVIIGKGLAGYEEAVLFLKDFCLNKN